MSLASLVLAALVMIAPAASPPDPRVQVAQGALVGRSADGVDAFKNIPFAAPPVGPLRWRPPQPVPAWTGARDAGAVGALCIQPPANGDNGVGPLPMSEDCLTLNVWAPAGRTEPLPVMFWIHGGGYNNGSGTAALYDGANLARRGVVLVTINYRLGRLGFFDHPALAAERPADEPAGNYGVMDQVAALQWVHDNIAAFGGDPDQVTIFGESAGGVAVTQLMISPRARGLFHRAVVESGLGRQQGISLETLRERGLAYAAGRDPRAIPAEDLLTPAPAFYGGDLIVNDGVYVLEDVEPAFAAGRQAAVPLIIGANSAEFWWAKASETSPMGAIDDAMTAEEKAAFARAYGGPVAYDAAATSDLVFVEPARRLARLHAAAGNPTYLYRFDVVSAAMPEPHTGATHASERQYVFDTLTASPWPTAEMDQRAADAMAGYWTRFGRTGNPNGGEAPAWPELGAEPGRLMEFTNDGPVAKPIPFADRLDLIEAYYARIRP